MPRRTRSTSASPSSDRPADTSTGAAVISAVMAGSSSSRGSGCLHAPRQRHGFLMVAEPVRNRSGPFRSDSSAAYGGSSAEGGSMGRSGEVARDHAPAHRLLLIEA